MSVLVFLVPIALFLGAMGLGAFLWSMRSGQYEDLEGSARRILLDDSALPDPAMPDPVLPDPVLPAKKTPAAEQGPTVTVNGRDKG